MAKNFRALEESDGVKFDGPWTSAPMDLSKFDIIRIRLVLPPESTGEEVIGQILTNCQRPMICYAVQRVPTIDQTVSIWDCDFKPKN
jgi:hypothetical protein